MKLIELRVCEAQSGKAPFTDWFNKLERTTGVKVSAALFQMEEGNFSDSKFVGQGVWERRIHSGPGYRIFFAREKDRAVVLLGGGSKKSQALQIQRAQTLLDYYRKSKT
jgi:putative addiction module killer protein